MTNKAMVKLLWKKWNEDCNCPWCCAKNKELKHLLETLAQNKVPLAEDALQWFTGLTNRLDSAFRIQTWRGVDRNLHKMFHATTGKINTKKT